MTERSKFRNGPACRGLACGATARATPPLLNLGSPSPRSAAGAEALATLGLRVWIRQRDGRDQALRVLLFRCAQDLIRRSLLHQLAALHDGYPVSHPVDDG